MKKIILLDFDDTLIQSSQHIIDCYNKITSDQLHIDDFVCEYTWKNLPIHKELWKNIVDAIVRDPSNIPMVDGAITFINSLSAFNDVAFLSKRYGKNIINNYLLDHDISKYSLLRFKHILVSENDDKIRYIKELRKHRPDAEIIYFEDRSDVVTSVYEYCTKIYIRNCPWNKNILNFGKTIKYNCFDFKFDI